LIIVQISHCHPKNMEFPNGFQETQSVKQKMDQQKQIILKEMNRDNKVFLEQSYANSTTKDKKSTIYFPYEDTNKNRHNTKVSGNFPFNI
jgi:hypothetical protein